MISIIVSSYRQEDFANFSSSLQKTIGVPYELIQIENANRYNLSSAYNLGAGKAKFNLLVFLHEDVKFDGQGWGAVLLRLFEENSSLGVVGVAGALKKSELPTGWGTGTSWYDRIHMNQSLGSEIQFQSTKKEGFNYEPVKVLDGVFLATSKKVWEEFPFDETLEGYHLYDLDFSLRVTQKYLGLISYEILLTHYSSGNYDSDWVTKTLHYHSRKDKQCLFDSDTSYFSKSRRAWFKALTFSKLSKKERKDYSNQMGIDLYSSVHAFCFRFPQIGRMVFKGLTWVGL